MCKVHYISRLRNIWKIAISEITISVNPVTIKIEECSLRVVALKIKMPPPNPKNITNIPRITTFNSKSSVNGVNIPDKNAAATMM